MMSECSHTTSNTTTAAAANAISTTLDGNLRRPLQSLFKTEMLVKQLSDLKTNAIHMCKNSCCTFNGPFVERDHCPFCKHAWRNRMGCHTKYFDQYPLHLASRPCIPTQKWPKRCAIVRIIMKMSLTSNGKTL